MAAPVPAGLLRHDPGRRGPPRAAASWQKVFRRFPDAKVVSLTATPFRADQQQLHGEVIYRYPFTRAMINGYHQADPLAQRRPRGALLHLPRRHPPPHPRRGPRAARGGVVPARCRPLTGVQPPHRRGQHPACNAHARPDRHSAPDHRCRMLGRPCATGPRPSTTSAATAPPRSTATWTKTTRTPSSSGCARVSSTASSRSRCSVRASITPGSASRRSSVPSAASPPTSSSSAA